MIATVFIIMKVPHTLFCKEAYDSIYEEYIILSDKND